MPKLNEHEKIKIAPDQKTDPLKEAKQKTAEDVGDFVLLIDGYARAALGLKQGSAGESILEQVLAVRQSGMIDTALPAIQAYLETYYQGRIKLNPISFSYQGVMIRYGVSDLGFVEVRISHVSSGTSIDLSANAEKVGNGDKPFSHARIQIFNYTDIQQAGVDKGNYYLRVVMDLLASGYKKNKAGVAELTTIPMSMIGSNGVFSFSAEYDFSEEEPGGALLLRSESVTIDGQAIESETLRIGKGMNSFELQVETADEGIRLSASAYPDMPQITIPYTIDILSALRSQLAPLLSASSVE